MILSQYLSLCKQKFHFLITSDSPVISAEPFGGPYEVIPKTESQTLQTADKLMERDLTVQAIPFYRTSNQSGGYTATIAMIGD